MPTTPSIEGQGSLELPGLYELARPKRRAGKCERPHYYWGPKASLPELGQHSSAKHNIYSDYIDRYIATLSKRHVQSKLKMTIIDGFCGGGLYTQDQKVVDGSPLRLLSAVDAARAHLHVERPHFDLDVDFVFVDSNRNHVEFLREELIKRGHCDALGSNIKLVTSAFEDAVDVILAGIRAKGRAHHSLFFLDQYGWSDVRLATVRRIMTELENPEVVMTFMVDALINLLHDKTSSLSALAAINYKRSDVRELLDLKNKYGHKGWKAAIQNTVYRHIQSCTGAEFYTPFFVHPPESHRDYWLIHLSKHHKAREEMGQVFWSTTNTMEHFGRAGFDALGFDPEVDVRQSLLEYTFDDDAAARSRKTLLEQIPPILIAGWKEGVVMTKRSLFAARANDTPVVGDLVDSQLAELRDAGEIVILNRKRDKNGDVISSVVRERSESFGWNDEIIRTSAPRLFSIFTKAA